MKKYIISLIVIFVFLSICKSSVNAQVLQTKESDTSATITWTEKTSSCYYVGYSYIPYDGYPEESIMAAKKMADKGKFKLSKSKKLYTIKKLKKNALYAVVLKFKKDGKWQYKINSHIVTKMGNINIDDDPYISTDEMAGVYWTYFPEALYEIIITDSKGNIVESHTGKKATPQFVWKFKFKKGETYTVKVRAIRKINKKYSKVGTTSTKWANYKVKELNFYTK